MRMHAGLALFLNLVSVLLAGSASGHHSLRRLVVEEL